MEEICFNWSSDGDDLKVGIFGLLFFYIFEVVLWGVSMLFIVKVGIELGCGLVLSDF